MSRDYDAVGGKVEATVTFMVIGVSKKHSQKTGEQVYEVWWRRGWDNIDS